jgi:hypothetical protein
VDRGVSCSEGRDKKLRVEKSECVDGVHPVSRMLCHTGSDMVNVGSLSRGNQEVLG